MRELQIIQKRKRRLNKLKDYLDVHYEILIAGVSDKDSASIALPMLNRVIAYPTTIFIDRESRVRKIHTGFSGPGTGIYYEKLVDEFTSIVDSLLNEA